MINVTKIIKEKHAISEPGFYAGHNPSGLRSKGYATIEATIIVPLCLGVIMITISLGIYMYNKTAAVSLSSRAAVMAAGMEHEGSGQIESTIGKYTGDRIGSLPLAHAQNNVRVSLTKVKAGISFSQSTGLKLIPGIPEIMSYETTQKVTRLDPARIIWTVKIAQNMTAKTKEQPVDTPSEKKTD